MMMKNARIASMYGLFGRALFTDLITFVLVLILGWFHFFVITLIKGTWHPAPNGEYMALSQDVVFNVSWILIIPPTIVFLLRSRRSLAKLQGELASKLGLQTKPISFVKLCLRELIVTFPGAVIVALFIRSNVGYNYWWEVRYAGYYTASSFLLVCAVAVAIAMTSASYALCVSREIRRHLRGDPNLEVKVYDPDGCGGLRWMTTPFLGFALVSIPLYLIGLGSFVVFTAVKGKPWTNPAALWNLTWPTVFGPLTALLIVRSTGIRRYLLKERAKQLATLSNRISTLSQLVKDADGDARAVKTHYADLSETIALRNELKKEFPVWPIPKRAVAVIAVLGPATSLFDTIILLGTKLFALFKGS
jgi:hypothetical protein